MKEDNISQLGDYDGPLLLFCEQQYTYGSCYISLFKFKSFDLFNTPQTALNFRHLLSCGTIPVVKILKIIGFILVLWQLPTSGFCYFCGEEDQKTNLVRLVRKKFMITEEELENMTTF